MAKRFYLPSLDGVRAVCIVLVVGAHVNHGAGVSDAWREASRYLFNGPLGVMVFFVLSGFLITYLMAREESRTGGVSLPAFYARRFIRIVPVYAVYLIVLFILTRTTDLTISGCQWATSVTYTKNFGCSSWIDGHLWSLSVEEQFYLIWPFAFAFLVGRSRLVFAAVLIGLAPLFRVYLYREAPHLYPFSFMTNMDALMIGSVVGLMYHNRPERVRRLLEWKPTLGRALSALAIYLVWVLRLELALAPFTVVLGNTVQAWGAAYLIVSYTTVEGGAVYRLLNLRAIRYAGVLSYSIYIWQQPFFSDPEIFGAESSWLLTFPTNLVAACLVAAISYHALEMPLAGLRRRFRPDGSSHSPAAAVSRAPA